MCSARGWVGTFCLDDRPESGVGNMCFLDGRAGAGVGYDSLFGRNRVVEWATVVSKSLYLYEGVALPIE